MRSFPKIFGYMHIVYIFVFILNYIFFQKAQAQPLSLATLRNKLKQLPPPTKEVERSTIPEKILVEYVSYACGDFYPRLVEVLSSPSGKQILAEEQGPFFLSFAPNIPNPEDSIFAASGNRFILHAFRNFRVTKNPIMGATKQEPTNRLAVFGWEIVPPYDVWVQKKGHSIKVRQRKPVKYYSQPASQGIGPFYDAKQEPCL